MTNIITPRALFSPTHLLNMVQLEIAAIRSADDEKRKKSTVEPNMKWIGVTTPAEIWPFEIFPNVRSVAGRWSVLNI